MNEGTSDKSNTDGNNGGIADTQDTPTTYSGDILLNLLVHMSAAGARSGITLYTSGQVFTGTIISMEEYVNQSLAQTQGTALHSIYAEIAKNVEPITEDTPVSDYRWIHLANGQVFAPGTKGLPDGGTLMRLERAAIIGWTLGSLTAS